MSKAAHNLYLMRHGPTEWNSANRIQGRTDVPLSDYGRQVVLARQLPADCAQVQWHSSPLRRARETARLMGLNAQSEASLTEIGYGAWEGQFVYDPALLQQRRSRGWTCRPPGGETRLEAFNRIETWLLNRSLQGVDGDLGAVVHGGLIKTIYAHVMNWDLCGESPESFGWEDIHCFALDRNGRFIPGHYHSISMGEDAHWRFGQAA
ncbi:MAG: histidine phosphatase family protein [Granulosicoccaceae bacterium]